ncbi:MULTISPECIES: hypothetical protein [Fischerella]|nr:hypothetical protein [Fischerella muscicola]
MLSVLVRLYRESGSIFNSRSLAASFWAFSSAAYRAAASSS